MLSRLCYSRQRRRLTQRAGQVLRGRAEDLLHSTGSLGHVQCARLVSPDRLCLSCVYST
jgi:hypothetical protein